MSGKRRLKLNNHNNHPIDVSLMPPKAAVRTETIGYGQLSLRSPEPRVKGITIVFSLLNTGQSQTYLLKDYKCLVCLVIVVRISGLPSFPKVT